MFFKKKIDKSFKKFITDIKSGSDNILELLGLTDSDFKEVPHSQILENPGDIASGVVKVKTKFNLKVFGLFDSIIIKEHDNGDIKHIFYTTTSDIDKIMMIRNEIFEQLGIGIYDSDKHTSFKDIEKIKKLSKGQFDSDRDDLANVWTLEKVIILLQYRTNPLHQFSLFVTKKQAQDIDRTIKRNGTILDLLTTDIESIFRTPEHDRNVETKEGQFKFIDYNYLLNERELNVFDKLEARQFKEQKDFSFRCGTSLTFTSSNDISTKQMVQVVEKLLKLYGSDDGGTKDIEVHEIDILDERNYWTGRTWNFNETHGLWDTDNSNERYAYTVSINYNSFETGFTLTILSYNNLIDLFSER